VTQRSQTQPGKPDSVDGDCAPEPHAQRAARAAAVSDEAFERAAGLFRAAGDVSRLKLLERLSDGEWCVT